jgi:hypothetical protein
MVVSGRRRSSDLGEALFCAAHSGSILVDECLDQVRLPLRCALEQWEHVSVLDSLHQRARALKRETHALYFAYRDPRTPWYARVVAACIIFLLLL